VAYIAARALFITLHNYLASILLKGRALAPTVSRQPVITEARVSLCVICGGQSVTETGVSPSTSVFACGYHSTFAPYAYFIHIPATIKYNISN
jgi:hypothetical protein